MEEAQVEKLPKRRMSRREPTPPEVVEGRRAFRQLVAESLEREGKTLTDGAKLCDIPASTWNAWMRGFTDPDIWAIQRIAKALGLDPTDLKLVLGWETSDKVPAVYQVRASCQLQAAADLVLAAVGVLKERDAPGGTGSLAAAAAHLNLDLRVLLQPVTTAGRFQIHTDDVLALAPASRDWDDWNVSETAAVNKALDSLVNVGRSYGAERRVTTRINLPSPFRPGYSLQIPVFLSSRDLALGARQRASLSIAVVGPSDPSPNLGTDDASSERPASAEVVAALLADYLGYRYRCLGGSVYNDAPDAPGRESDVDVVAVSLIDDPAGLGANLVWSTTSLSVTERLARSASRPPDVVVVVPADAPEREQWMRLAKELQGSSTRKVVLEQQPRCTEANPFASPDARYDLDVESALRMAAAVSGPLDEKPLGTSRLEEFFKMTLPNEPIVPPLIRHLLGLANSFHDGILEEPADKPSYERLLWRDQLAVAVRTPGLLDAGDAVSAIVAVSAIHQNYMLPQWVKLTFENPQADLAAAQMLAGRYGGFLNPILRAAWYLVQKPPSARKIALAPILRMKKVDPRTRVLADLLLSTTPEAFIDGLKPLVDQLKERNTGNDQTSLDWLEHHFA